ncbi:MAG: hypothetical protein PHQ98_03320 [Candidatus ainarchaeum sp.]|nr:hypothetical protein [Candidatus ainarchaeum sp.]
MILQNEFNKTLKKFDELESFRNDIWDKCLNLINKGYEYEAYSLLLATWNFAYFRYIIKEIKPIDLQSAITETNPIFKKLKNKKFEDVDFENDLELREDISKIYNIFCKISKQTGASKMMALKNPNLFVMWDTQIRKKWKIKNKATSKDYLEFLIKMKNEFKKINFTNVKKPIAKAIDEYNFIAENKKTNKHQTKID